MKNTYLLLFGILCIFNHAYSETPDKAIPFIFDSHLYIQGTLADSVHVSLIYDSGADRLYMDKDYINLSDFGKLPFKKGKAKMGGAGNGQPKTIDIIIDPVPVKMGSISHTERITPIINLREILGRHADGMIGNNAMWAKPLMVNYQDGYLLQLDSLSSSLLKGYTKLPAQLDDNRFDIECEMNIDSAQTLKGLFRLDMGCGSTVILTNAARKELNIDGKAQAVCYYSNMGVGGEGSDVNFRINSFKMLDVLSDVVISASYNTEGALSERPYLGIIGNEILGNYNFIIDAPNNAIYAKRNTTDSRSYQKSSRLQMSYIDRTDICDGWVISSLYDNGIAQKAGIEINDIILAINGEDVRDISWEEQRNGLNLEGNCIFKIKKKNGSIIDYILYVDKQII